VRVQVRLYATFSQFAPSRKAGDPFSVDLAEGATITDLIRHLGIPEPEVHLVMIDGRVIHERTVRLAEDARIGLFPPVGGG
jgi:sulfur carrier protein ThiS